MIVHRLRAVASPFVRWSSTSTPAPEGLGRLWGLLRKPFVKKVAMPLPFALAGAYGCWEVMQQRFGTGDNFFHGSFVTEKDPDDIAEFYQAEDLLRIISVHPFLFDLFMNKVDPDVNEATEETALLGVGETHMRVKLLGMEVSFEIIEHEKEMEDGETKMQSFLRHERFIDWMPLLADYGVKIMLWDQTWKYGFNTLEDGKVEVYHHCERFAGPWPIRFIIAIHQQYVLWACKKFINGDAFGTDDLEEQQEELACIPLHVFKGFLAKLKEEKEKVLENHRKNPEQDAKAIEETMAELSKLHALSEQTESPISIARRPLMRKPSMRNQGASMKLVVGDAATDEVLKGAIKDAKGNLAVRGAVQELVKHQDLEWGGRPSASRRRVAGSPEASGNS